MVSTSLSSGLLAFSSICQMSEIETLRKTKTKRKISSSEKHLCGTNKDLLTTTISIFKFFF